MRLRNGREVGVVTFAAMLLWKCGTTFGRWCRRTYLDPVRER